MYWYSIWVNRVKRADEYIKVVPGDNLIDLGVSDVLSSICLFRVKLQLRSKITSPDLHT